MTLKSAKNDVFGVLTLMYPWKTYPPYPCTALLATFKDTALFFVCKRTMSEMKSCISGILKGREILTFIIKMAGPFNCYSDRTKSAFVDQIRQDCIID